MIFRKLYLALGLLALLMGFIGVFLPIWPTTPFLIVAAWAFQKGSPRLHNWLIQQPVLGPPILAWQQHGIISRRAKFFSITLMTISFTGVIVFRPISGYLKIAMAAIGIAIALFVYTRPSSIPDRSPMRSREC